MDQTGLIFDIQSFSVHDGPGCRTSVFFTGCPLKCSWCANPESWKRGEHIMVAENVCKWESGCRACKDACKYGAITFDKNGKFAIDMTICDQCDLFECVSSCPNNVLKQCVKTYQVDELMTILKRDFDNWGPEGGVTFTGGEPLMQAPFLIEVLKKCNESQIHTAIETSAYAKTEVFLEVFKYIDFAFIDVKNMDSERHNEETGVHNDLILRNIEALKKSGWRGRLVLRQPTIGDYNDSDDNAADVIDFMNALDLFEINLLKFHRMGETKWNQLGKTYAYAKTGDVSNERLAELQQLYLRHDIACYVGDNTPF